MKRFCLLLSVIACLCLSAVCGPADVHATTTSSSYTYTEEDYTTYAQTLLAQIVAMEDADINTYLSSGSLSEGLCESLTSWQTMREELGAFVSVDSTDVTIEEDSVTVVVNAKFEKREGTYTITMTPDGSSVLSSGFEKVLTIGEIFKKAALNTLIGMGTVFCVLIFISFIISLFKYIPDVQAKFAKEPVRQEETAALPASVPVLEDEEELVDDGELVAVITAAICAAMAEEGNAVSKDGLIVRSIRRSRR